MHAGIDHAPSHDSGAEFSVTLSLVDDQIVAITAGDASRLRTILENDAAVARPAPEQSVIDRARLVLTRRALAHERPDAPA